MRILGHVSDEMFVAVPEVLAEFQLLERGTMTILHSSPRDTEEIRKVRESRRNNEPKTPVSLKPSESAGQVSTLMSALPT
jgi:hypothetical protein